MYIKALDDAIKGAESISNYTNILRISEMFLNDEEREIRKSIEKVITRDGYPTDYLIRSVIDIILRDIDMGEILANHVASAVATNTEFGNRMLFFPLLSAARSSRNFTTIVNGTGWGSAINVIINMDSTAGTLDEYASGVKAVREALQAEADMAKAMRPKHWKKSKPKARDPIAASRYWKKHVYQNPNQMFYNTTMEERIRLSGSPAPYWKLLDKGSISMQSDWGGIPYPQGTATNFIDNAATEIRREFIRQMGEAESRFYRFSVKVMRMYEEIHIGIGHIVDRVEEIVNTEITVVANLISRYGNDLNVSKLKSTLDAISRGDNIKTTAEGRIEMTARGGHTKRVRPYLSTLIAGMR